MKNTVYIMLALFVSAGTTTAGWKELFDKVFSMHVQDSTVIPEIVFHDTAVGMMVCNVPQELFIANGMSPHYLVANYKLKTKDVLLEALRALRQEDYAIFDALLEKYSDSIVDFNSDYNAFQTFINYLAKIDQQTFMHMKNYVKRYLFAMNRDNKWKLDSKKIESLLIKTLQNHYNNTCPVLVKHSSIDNLIDFGCFLYGYSYDESYMLAFLRCGFPSTNGGDKVWYRTCEGGIASAYCVFLIDEPLKEFELDPANKCNLIKEWKLKLINNEGNDYTDMFFKAYVSYLFMRRFFQNIHNPEVLYNKMTQLRTALVQVLPKEVDHFMQTPQARTFFGQYSVENTLDNTYKITLLSEAKNKLYTDIKVYFK